MIPQHLKGMSAAAIMARMQMRGEPEDFYKAMLLISIMHALCACDDTDMFPGDYIKRAMEAEGRAIAFLNMLMPGGI